ncbi:hypothetical protein J6590_005215 [Homalodisca vitripennis]|nr:hypothetical protein J6590_005215 [Homalodisca vitripennis]
MGTMCYSTTYSRESGYYLYYVHRVWYGSSVCRRVQRTLNTTNYPPLNTCERECHLSSGCDRSVVALGVFGINFRSTSDCDVGGFTPALMVPAEPDLRSLMSRSTWKGI